MAVLVIRCRKMFDVESFHADFRLGNGSAPMLSRGSDTTLDFLFLPIMLDRFAKFPGVVFAVVAEHHWLAIAIAKNGRVHAALVIFHCEHLLHFQCSPSHKPIDIDSSTKVPGISTSPLL